MTFVFPAGLFFLAAAPLILALYLRRVRPREQTLPSLLLWTQTLQLKAPQRWLGKVRAWGSLLLQLIILLLLTFALCRPESASSPSGARVIVLDTRARMQATDPFGQSAFAKARRFAEAYVETAREHSPIALITTGETPRLIQAFSEDPKRLREALDSLQPENGGGDWNEAIEFARDTATALGAKSEIVALTDRPMSVNHEHVHIQTFGTPSDNLNFAAAGARSTGGLTSLFLRATSHGSDRREARLEIENAGRLLESRNLTIDPTKPQDFNFEFPASSEPFIARLMPTDRLAADNSVTLKPESLPPLRALLVSTGNWFVEKALRAEESLQFEILKPEAWNPELSRAFDVTLFDREVPVTFKNEGHFIFLDCAPVPNTGRATNPAVVESDATNPLLRAVRPAHWRIGEQLTLPSNPTRRELVSGTGGPLVITSESENFRWAALLFPLEKSDLPLRASFPVFLHDLIAWTSQSSRTPTPILAPLDAEGANLETTTTTILSGIPLILWPAFSEWRWLALIAFGLLLSEWRSYHRQLTE